MRDNDDDLCPPGAECPTCQAERAARARIRAEQTPPAPAPSGDGVIPIPYAFTAESLLDALANVRDRDDETITMTRGEAVRVVTTLAAQRTPDDASTIDRLRERLTQSQDAHRRDIATIGDTLMSEAEDRGWCEIYDEVVEQLNANLSVELPRRARNVTIYLSDDEGTSHFYVTVSVDGEEDEGDAARQVLDMLRGQVSDWGYA